MHRRLVVALLTLGVTLFGFVGAAQAAPAVTNTNDSGPGSLRQAIAEAASGETIAVPAGDYQVSSKPLEITKSLTLAGQASNATVVRSTGPFRVFEIGTEGPAKLEVTLSGMTIRDGRVFEYPTGFGAGIGAVNTNLVLRAVNVTGNLVNANGENAAEKGGSAIGAGLIVILGTLTMADSQVTGNAAEAIGGPGAPGGSAQGGGLIVLGGSYTIERSTISGNVANASGGRGAADEKQDGGIAAGGGMGTDAPQAPSSIVASTISGNVAEAKPGPGGDATGLVGGGGFFGRTEGQPVAITNSTFTQNVAGNGSAPGPVPTIGGGLVLIAEEGTITITSATVSGNRVESAATKSQAGNLLVGGTPGSVLIRNSIVANGAGPAGTENCGAIPEGTAVIASQGFNLESADQCGFKSAGDQVNKDPQLLPLQGFGGPTQTMAPTAGSPIIDQGAAFGLTSDQHGAPRPIDLPQVPNSTAPGADGSDIGAYELQPPSGLKLGKLKTNKKKGTATLTVTLPSPSAGLLTLKGKGLKSQKATIKGQTSLKLKVLAKGGAKKALLEKGQRKVQISVTYAPTGNTAVTQKRKAKLVKKKKAKKPTGSKR